MTQAQLAQVVGVTRSAVAQWETDRAGQVGGNLARVAAALGTGVEHLLTGGATLAPAAPETADEIALLRLYREAPPADRQLLLRTALRLSREPASSADEADSPGRATALAPEGAGADPADPPSPDLTRT